MWIRPKRLLFLFAILSTTVSAPTYAQSETPDWLSIHGESRVRYQSTQNQFRVNRSGGDQLLLFRTLVDIKADTGPITFGLELQDSRAYLDDSGTPLTSSTVNPLDILQFYSRIDALPGLLGAGSKGELTLGRQTVSIGSKRQIERADFGNVIKSYTGAHYQSEATNGDELHLFYVVPIGRFPSSRSELDDNALSGDEEQWGRRIWAAHYRRADLLGERVPGLWGEAFVYGLNERDRDTLQTPNRSYIAPGARIYRRPAPGQWDIDLEGSFRRGTRRASSAASDQNDLDVRASMLFASVGYTWDAPWRPHLAFEYYYASGDNDPTDDIFGQHERLFGGRRTDLNNTSTFGPLTPANLSAPGVRFEIKPNDRWDARLYYHAAHLDSASDSWVVAKLRDPSGNSGRFIGHEIDARARYWVVPKTLRLEVGGSGLIFGRFAKTVPNGPSGNGSVFGFVQMTYSF